MHEYFSSLGISDLDGQVDFYLYWDVVPALARIKGIGVEEARQRFDAIGHSGTEGKQGDRLTVILKDASVIAGYNSSPTYSAHNGAHSMGHSYHNLLYTLNERLTSHSLVAPQGPAWLSEGVTEFQTIRSFAKGGLYQYDRRRELFRQRASAVDAPLPDLETYGALLPVQAGYDLSTMAAELLASRAGEESVITYWQLLRPGTTWQEAFETAFGMTVEEFYPLFADHRAAGFPTVDLPALGLTLDELPQVDREALVAFYNATGGSNWANNTNWLSDEHIGRWHGVVINPVTGRVNELRLSRNRLSGQLPPELGNLTELRILSVWANQLRRAIPSELAVLTKLEDFGVGGNQLSGEIPTWLGNFSNLRVLHLVSNQFTGSIPSWIGDLPLQGLYLSHNRLSGDVPTELGNISSLQTVYLAGNNLTGCIPAGLRDVPDNDFAEAGLPFCGQ